jgi:hypothetical protein
MRGPAAGLRRFAAACNAELSEEGPLPPPGPRDAAALYGPCADTSAKYEPRFMVKNELFGSKMQGCT